MLRLPMFTFCLPTPVIVLGLPGLPASTWAGFGKLMLVSMLVNIGALIIFGPIIL